MAISDVVFRDIKTTTVSQMRDIHTSQGLHFTGIAINSRDVFFKDRFMLAPKERNTLKGGKPCLWLCSDQTGARAAEELLKMENHYTKLRHISEFMKKNCKKCKNFRVVDPGCLSWIPDPKFFHLGWSIRLPDLGSGSAFASKNSNILTQKIVYKLRILIFLPILDPRFGSTTRTNLNQHP